MVRLRIALGIFAIIFMLSARSSWGLTVEELKVKFPRHFHSLLDTEIGKIHYQDTGEAGRPVIVLVHGVSGAMFVWDKNVGFLQGAGFRVIRLDLMGRGFSDRIDASSYGLDLYVQELEILLAGLFVNGPFFIVGSSFGAIVSTEFAIRHPQSVEGIILIGPAGFPISVPLIAKLRDVPVLGDLLFWALGKSTIEKQNKKYFVDENPAPDFLDFFIAQLDVPGTGSAMRKTMANAPVQSFVSSYEKLGRLSMPVGIIWGNKDATFPYDNHKILISAVPRAKLVTIDNSGHIPQYERPAAANLALEELLSEFRRRSQ